MPNAFTLITGKKYFFPVVHVENPNQALRNTECAFDNGADGVFLINHMSGAEELIEAFEFVRMFYPTDFIGLNFLDQATGHALLTCEKLKFEAQALWVDDPGITDVTTSDPHSCVREHIHWNGLYFASVAFKGQARVHDVAAAAQNGAAHAEVVVTSGPGTGYAPDTEKIQIMKEAIGTHPLAIASGMTPENIHLFLPYADIFMVATGISDSFTELNSEHTRAIAEIIHNQ